MYSVRDYHYFHHERLIRVYEWHVLMLYLYHRVCFQLSQCTMLREQWVGSGQWCPACHWSLLSFNDGESLFHWHVILFLFTKIKHVHYKPMRCLYLIWWGTTQCIPWLKVFCIVLITAHPENNESVTTSTSCYNFHFNKTKKTVPKYNFTTASATFPSLNIFCCV